MLVVLVLLVHGCMHLSTKVNICTQLTYYLTNSNSLLYFVKHFEMFVPNAVIKRKLYLSLPSYQFRKCIVKLYKVVSFSY